MNPSNIYILNIKNVNYCCIINGISKRETIKLLKKILTLLKESGTL